jgi:hypothetical protein
VTIPGPTYVAKPGDPPLKKSKPLGFRGDPSPKHGVLLTIEVAPSEIAQAAQRVTDPAGILATFGVKLGGQSTAVINAQWDGDHMEIYGGEAGLGKATGFGSLYGHQARVEISGAQYGNYFPARYLITFSGYVNPMGPKFVEFKGGVILSPDGSRQPWSFEHWSRDEEPASSVDWDKDRGYVLKL